MSQREDTKHDWVGTTRLSVGSFDKIFSAVEALGVAISPEVVKIFAVVVG
jgi:hypothetical protein